MLPLHHVCVCPCVCLCICVCVCVCVSVYVCVLLQQQQQRPGSASASSPFRKSASPAGHSHAAGGSDGRHGSSAEVRRSVSPHRPPSSAAAAGGSSGTPSRLGGPQRDKASPARPTNDRSHHAAKSSPLHTQELLNKGTYKHTLHRDWADYSPYISATAMMASRNLYARLTEVWRRCR